MENEQKLERIYEFLENKRFEDLSSDEQQLVLTVMSVEDYNRMYETLSITKEYFQNHPEVNSEATHFKQKSKNTLSLLANYPIKLYQVAAILLLMISLLLILRVNSQKKEPLLVSITDTVYVQKLDTIVLDHYDTIRISTKPKIKITNPIARSYSLKQPVGLYESDCQKRVCPDDIGAISDMVNRSNFIGDSLLQRFIVSTD